MADFNPALPLPIKWTIGDDRFVEGGQVLSLTIPVDSVTHLIDHLQNLVNTKAKDGDVFSSQSLTKLRDLTNDLENWENLEPSKLNLNDEQLKGFNRITDVQSLANERYEIDDGESLLSKNIIPINLPKKR